MTPADQQPITIIVIAAIVILSLIVIGVFLFVRAIDPRNDPNLPPDHWSKLTPEEHKARIKRDWQNLKTAYGNLSPEEREELHKDVGTVISAIIPTQFVVTCPNCVVTYQPAALHGLLSHLFSRAKIEQQIRDILASNPDADLTKFEQALGIKIVNVQRRGASAAGGIWT